MAGSISYEKDRDRWVVAWRQPGKKQVKIRKYRGFYLTDKRMAEKCLIAIQGRWEDHESGKCVFNIDEFTRNGWTDTAEFYKEWMDEVVRPNLKPATIKCYQSYWDTWLGPFFKKHPVLLHEIRLNTLTKLKNSITKSGKTQYNIMNCLRAFLDYAYRSDKISNVPPFPKKNTYDLKKPEIHWVSEEDQLKIIDAIPEEERPIFQFLKYHYRRPGEACALQWGDWDEINEVFTIRRTFSNQKLVETTKTRAIHYVPCDSDFSTVMKSLKQVAGTILPSDFIFLNPRGKREGSHYTLRSLGKVWKAACDITEIHIGLYQGTKHSSCTQFVNEKGGTLDELQILTDHARRDSVEHYAEVGVERKRKMMEQRKVDLRVIPSDPKSQNQAVNS